MACLLYTSAVLISAVIGALPYAAGAVEAPLAFLNGMLFGIFAALYLIRRGNIWGIGAFHAAWSFVRDIVFGTPDQVATAVVLLVGMILVGGKRPWGNCLLYTSADTAAGQRSDPALEPDGVRGRKSRQGKGAGSLSESDLLYRGASGGGTVVGKAGRSLFREPLLCGARL